MPYDLGDVVPLSVETRDQTGTLADAGAVVLTIKRPDGTTETPAITHPSVGVYRCDYTPPTAGTYRVKWIATGQNASSTRDAFDVREDFPLLMFSLTDAKNILNKTTVADNEKIRDLIESTTSIVEGIVGPIVPRQVTEVVNLSGRQPYFVTRMNPIVSVQSISSVVSGGLTYTVADFDVDLESGIVRSLRGIGVAGTVRITYTAGRMVVPAAIRDAGRLVLRWLWSKTLGPHAGPKQQGTKALPWLADMGSDLPIEVLELLRPYSQVGSFA